MSVGLLAPLGLAALAALALPLLIHLVRRIELRTVDFPALRWISEKIRPRSRLRFERPWLLLVRLVLLAVFAFLLARPFINENALARSSWVVVAPGSDFAVAKNAITMPDADWRWLAPGFPAIETPTPSGPVATASLLREIDAELPPDTKLAVIVPAEVAGLDGERPQLSREVEWHVVPGSTSSTSAVDPNAPIALGVRYSPSAETALKYVRAAANALNAHGSVRFTLDAQTQDVEVSEDVHDLIWLGADLTPAIRSWIENGGTAIVDAKSSAVGTPIWRDADGHVLARVQRLGTGRLIALSGALAPNTFPALLDADFPERLHALLQGEPAAPTRAAADALRPAQKTSAADRWVAPASMKPLDPWLVLSIALLILIERVIATRRRVST